MLLVNSKKPTHSAEGRPHGDSLKYCTHETSVADWVIDHPETLAVFKRLGIDYCCGGKSLETACREQRLDVRSVMATLEQCIAAARNGRSAPPG